MTVTLLLYCDYQDLNWSLDLISPVYLMLQNTAMISIQPLYTSDTTYIFN